jgi:hypothetical protein
MLSSTQHSNQVKSTCTRQKHIEDQDIRRARIDHAQRLIDRTSSANANDGRLKTYSQDLSQDRVIFNDEYVGLTKAASEVGASRNHKQYSAW